VRTWFLVRTYLRGVIFRSSLILIIVAPAVGCSRPVDAPYQSTRNVLDLPLYDTVKAAGSDTRSANLESDRLKSLVETASQSFHEERIERDFKELALDPSQLRIVERTPVRVHFIGEASGARNALGINLSGIGLEEGDPQILFPNASCTVGLHQTGRHFGDGGLLDREPFGERQEGKPLQPGDFIDLGTLSADTTLEFFLISNAGGPSLHTYTAHPERNHDSFQHMVAVVDEASGILLLSFEDLPNLGDKDFGDCVFAVELSGYNVQAMLGRIDPWRRAKQLGSVAGIAFLVFGTPVGYAAWRRYVRRRRALRAHGEAAKLARNNMESAITRIKDALDTPMDPQSRRELIDLECTLLENVGDGASMVAVLDADSNAVYAREQASLLAGRALLTLDDPDRYEIARDHWREDNGFERRWQELDVDALLIRGENEGVESALLSQTFATKEDAGLLARLGLAALSNDPERAATFVNKAVALNPQNAEVHLATAQVLEHAADWGGAEQSLATALELSPRDPAIRLAAGGYFRRRGAYDKALGVWAAGLARPSNPDIWLQTLFWQKVARPNSIPLSGIARPDGGLRPLVDFMESLSDDEFWNPTRFDEIGSARPDLAARQEVFWLSLLEALRNRNEEAALYLLNVKRFGTKSWCPELETALMLIASYRTAGFLDPSAAGNNANPQQPFFIQLDQAARGEIAMSDKLRQAIEGDQAFSLAFRTAGWNAAASALEKHRGS